MEIPVIKNIEKLANTDFKRDALEILEAGYEATLTEKVIRSQIILEGNSICIGKNKICIDDYENIFFVAVGKCAVDASLVFEELLGDKITEGIVLDVRSGIFKKLRSEVGSHPLPSEKNVEVTRSIAEMLEKATEKDLVLAVISGGGSSLLCLPYETDCEIIQKVTKALMKGGATIEEINTIRKHLSGIQGGQFAKLVYPATLFSFIFSDVPGNDLSIIASGPTVMDKTTKEDAEKIFNKYGLEKEVPSLVVDGKISFVETPKDIKFFEKVTNILVTTNEVFLGDMKKKAEELGYDAYIESLDLQGEAREVGKILALKNYQEKSCYLFGGETTVTVKGDGVGGRNQELVLGALPYILEDVIVIAVSSDGWDNSDVAGAIGDDVLYKEALNKDFDIEEFLDNNDSFNFFKKVGGHIKTGKTGINVSDIYMILKK